MNFNATLIGQLVTFAIFVWFTMKFVWPLLLQQMQDREKRIADGLAAADEGTQKLAEAEVKLHDAIEEGKQRAAEIIAQGQKRGDEIIEEAKQTAREEGERLKAAALAEIEQERTKVKEELKSQVAALALSGAEQILMREVDKNAHNDVLGKISSAL